MAGVLTISYLVGVRDTLFALTVSPRKRGCSCQVDVCIWGEGGYVFIE